MIEPYTAVALQTPHHNCQTPQDWDKNIETICEAMDAAIWMAALQYPVKRVTLGGGGHSDLCRFSAGL